MRVLTAAARATPPPTHARACPRVLSSISTVVLQSGVSAGLPKRFHLGRVETSATYSRIGASTIRAVNECRRG